MGRWRRWERGTCGSVENELPPATEMYPLCGGRSLHPWLLLHLQHQRRPPAALSLHVPSEVKPNLPTLIAACAGLLTALGGGSAIVDMYREVQASRAAAVERAEKKQANILRAAETRGRLKGQIAACVAMCPEYAAAVAEEEE